MARIDTVDRIFARLLWIAPQPEPAVPAYGAAAEAGADNDAVDAEAPASRTFGIALLISGLRYYWRTRHPRRFDILPLSALILFIILASLGYDIWQLLS